MISVGFAKIFDAKIIDGKSEGGRTSAVAPEPRGKAKRSIAIGGKVCFELIIAKNTGLFEAIHAFADFKIYISLGIKVVRGEVLFFQDFVRDIPAIDSHILKKNQVGADEEIFEITSTVSSTFVCIGNGAVEM